jgi:hypothetical protein
VRLTTVLMATAALVAGGSLGACQRSKPQVPALPLEMGAAAPLGEAPPPGGLPPAPPARIGTLSDARNAYAYPDRAWGMSWAFGDSPPDYAFYDDGVTPWVWVADDDSECLAEPVPGGERYYYFEPGAYTPFYVQDPSYGYGFENGQLVAIYARGGREIAPGADPAAAATAGQYLARGRMLRQAAGSQPHQAVAAGNWSARRGLIAAEHASFARDAAHDPAWLAYHDQHLAQDQARLAPEATRREAWAAQTDSRLGQPGRAQREQRLAQAIAQGGQPVAGRQAVGAPIAAPRPGAALDRYAAAAPHPGAPRFLGRGRTPPAERPQAMARSAGEHASDAAYQARAPVQAHQAQPRPAFAERHAAQPPPEAARPHVFHPQAAAQPHPPPAPRPAAPARSENRRP